MESKIRRSRGVDRVMTVIFYLVAIFFFALLIGFAGKVIIGGLMGAKPGMFRFARKGSIGNQLFNTIYLVFISLLVSIPLGVCAGIYLAMYAKQGKMTKFLRMCIETLSSLPSMPGEMPVQWGRNRVSPRIPPSVILLWLWTLNRPKDSTAAPSSMEP